MRKRRLVRWQLMLLGAVTLLIIWRVAAGPPRPDGLAAFVDIDKAELAHEAFTVSAPIEVDVSAVGSYQGAIGGPLAAYGWLLRAEDQELVWAMTPDAVVPGRGTLALAETRLRLEPGTYHAYFASYGNSRHARRGGGMFSFKRHWTDDQHDWKFVVTTADAAQQHVRAASLEDAREVPDLVWSTAPMRSRKNASFLFRVDEPIPMHIYAIGEVCEGTPCDWGLIVDAVSGDTLWVLDEASSEPAGGWAINRKFDGVVELPAGVYRAKFSTDTYHAYRHWIANPPFDPRGWGLTLSSPRSDAVQPFSADELPVIVALDRMTNDVCLEQAFTLNEPAVVVVDAVGELSGESNAYDYGWLARENGTRVWEMRYSDTVHAGGADRNREVTAFVPLPAGTYHVGYRTDDSHSYGDWNSDAPRRREAWGIRVAALDEESAGAASVGADRRTCQGGEAHVAPVPPDEPVPPAPVAAPLAPGATLVQKVGLGGDARVRVAFELDGPARLRIRALGEITSENRYDYGWIERSDGARVWEMTYANTSHAGGDERNRRFDGVVELPRGTYELHFRTDFLHDASGFTDDAPDAPEAWGITVERLP